MIFLLIYNLKIFQLTKKKEAKVSNTFSNPCFKKIKLKIFGVCDCATLYTVTILVSVTTSRCKGILGCLCSMIPISKCFTGRNCVKSLVFSSMPYPYSIIILQIEYLVKTCRFFSDVKKMNNFFHSKVYRICRLKMPQE